MSRNKMQGSHEFLLGPFLKGQRSHGLGRQKWLLTVSCYKTCLYRPTRVLKDLESAYYSSFIKQT
jgi:hypothetical protein